MIDGRWRGVIIGPKRSKKVKGRMAGHLANLCDHIAEYLEQELERSGSDALELRRGNVAERFGCAPSQINYVLETRFTPERGFAVESRRGGGGFIRLIRLRLDPAAELVQYLVRRIGDRIPQEPAMHVVDHLGHQALVSEREAALMRAVLLREAIGLEPVQRDLVRARLLKSMLLTLLRGG